jgi:release factor glutamine methyltransferase
MNQLKTAGAIAAFDVDLLLSRACRIDQATLLAHGERILLDKEQTRFESWIKRRAEHEPIAYILGNQPFYGRDFFVNKSVLIPRPESELIIDEAKKDLADANHPIIIDVGTGSGCLAITAALEFPSSQVIATDVSADALAVARKNAKQLEAGKIKFYHGNLLEPLVSLTGQVDAIFANLPYLPQNEIDLSPTKNELSYEPPTALLADDGGLALIKTCTQQAAPLLKSGGQLSLEMLPDQIPLFLTWLMLSGLPFSSRIVQDLSGRNRIVVLAKTG